jgi:hypothetical protein
MHDLKSGNHINTRVGLINLYLLCLAVCTGSCSCSEKPLFNQYNQEERWVLKVLRELFDLENIYLSESKSNGGDFNEINETNEKNEYGDIWHMEGKSAFERITFDYSLYIYIPNKNLKDIVFNSFGSKKPWWCYAIPRKDIRKRCRCFCLDEDGELYQADYYSLPFIEYPNPYGPFEFTEFNGCLNKTIKGVWIKKFNITELGSSKYYGFD